MYCLQSGQQCSYLNCITLQPETCSFSIKSVFIFIASWAISLQSNYNIKTPTDIRFKETGIIYILEGSHRVLS